MPNAEYYNLNRKKYLAAVKEYRRKNATKLREYYKAYREKNKRKYVKYREKAGNESSKRWKTNARCRLRNGTASVADERLWARMKLHGIKQKGKRCSISVEYILSVWRKQKGKCALSGLELKRSAGSHGPLNASIDKICPRRGYVKGNVRFLASCVNSFKDRMSDEQMIEIAKAILDNRARGVL